MLKSVSIVIVIVCQLLSVGFSLNPGPGVVTIYYKSGWGSSTFIYYNDGTGWTPIPGLQLYLSTNSSFPNLYTNNVPANSLEFVFDDSHNHWDNNGGRNYKVGSPGIYTVINGVVTTIQTFPAACPGEPECSGNGTCNQNTFTCTCNSGYFGRACDGICPHNSNGICGGHGKCNDGASGDGSCNCDAPWLSCGGDPCSTNVQNDTLNCGTCGNVCASGIGVNISYCSNAKCYVECDEGYLYCDGQCINGTHCSRPPLPGCQIFNDNQCSGNIIVTDPSFEARRWYTPKRGDPDYLPSYQDYSVLVGNAHVEYSSNRLEADITILALHRNTSTVIFTYYFDGVAQSSPNKHYDTSYANILLVSISTSDGAKISLEPIDFIWNNAPIAARQGDYRNGQKGAIVEMFGWPHTEIEQECSALASMGYLGVKLFPPQEQVLSYQPFNNYLNPWYFMYQPVSYRLEGRMGTRDQLRQMIQTCRKYGVRVYADAVVNHMSGGGNDANPYHRYDSGSCVTWGNKTSSSSSPSPFYTQDFVYTYGLNTDEPPSQEFPAVPYGPTDFHCERVLNSWNDPLDLNAGWLTGLVDLNTEKENVRERIADYMTDLLGIGFSGFRIDAAKHIHPDDLVAIFSKLRRNLGGTLPEDFITWWEILLGGEAEMLMCNPDSGYNYGGYLAAAFLSNGFSQDDLNKIKIWNSGYPKEPHADCNSVPNIRDVVQNDDADQQTDGSTSRDMGDQGCVLVNGCDISVHRGFEVKLFENPNGINDNDNDFPIRAILSSFYFPANGGRGIPDGLSDCSLCTVTCSGCLSVPYMKAYDPNSCGYDSTYTRVHRDKAIITAMRSWMHLSTNVSNADLQLPENCT